MTRPTREQWEKRIRQWQSSGLDAASFAAREGVTPERLRWWRWQLGLGPGASRRSGRAQFVEVVLSGEEKQEAAAHEAPALEVHLGEKRVVVRPGFDVQSLRQVLAVLEEG